MYSILRNDGAVIYSPAQIEERPVYGAHLTQELNQAGNLSFSILPGHPLYSVLKPMETYLSAFDDDEEMFYGRVISVDDPVFTGTRNIECEGAYAFLEDADMPPDTNSSSGGGGVSQSASAFFTRCINTYNSSINDSRRQFAIGTISHSKASQVDTYSISSYTSVKSCLESMLLNKLGGFIRIRRGQNGTHIVDWIEDYGVTDASEIEIGENVLDQTTRMSVENFFTVIRPVGADGLLLPEETLNVFGSDEMNRYGRIIKTITYSDIKNVTDLRAKANALIARINGTVFINTEVKLIDMHYIDGTIPKIHLGDSFTNIHGLENIKMTVANLERDFENPANDHLGFKNQKDLEVSDLDGSSRGGTGKSGSRSAVGGYGQRFKFISEDETNLYLHAEEIRINADKKLELTANEIELVSTREREDRGNIYEIQGSGVYVNGDHINAICGKYTISKDGKTITLIDGTDFNITQNGATISVGTAIVDHAHGIDEIQGSALWTERNHITAVSGKYRIARVSDPDHPGQYIEKLIVIEGGGFFLERNGAEFGLYDEGNLTGGVMVEKLNDNTVTTHIKGDRVIVGTVDDQTAQTMQSKFGEVDGLIAARATIGQLNALSARVGNIEADYITTDNLAARFGQITGSLLLSGNMVVSGDGSIAVAASKMTFSNTAGSTVTTRNPKDFIRNVQVVQDGTTTYKLQYQLAFDSDSTWRDAGTFNRAASVNLTGSWSSRTFTVTETNSGETYSETPVYSTGTGYSQYDSITVDSFSSEHYAYARVLSSSNQGSNVLFGFKIDATGQYSDGQAAVTLTDPSWSNTSTPNSANTVSVSTSGRPTQLSKSTTLHLTVGSWSSGSIPVYIRETSTSGTVRAQNSVSMPAVSSTTWTNTTGRTWRADISIGGVTRSSDTKDFGGYYTDGQAAVTLTDPSWNSISTLTSSRTVTVSTSGRPTQLSKSKTVFLTTGSWGSGSIPIYIRDGSTSGTIVAQSSVSLPGVSGFDTTAPANESYTSSGGTTYTNNSSGYQILSTGSSGTAAIVVKSTWTQGGSTVTGKSYLSGAPTALYRAAYSSGDTAGYNRSAAESPTGFSSSSLANESYAISGGTTITNNSDGYYLQSTGSSGVAYIVVTGSWTQSGHSKTSKNYLRGAPTAIYRKGYSDGAASSASPEWIGQGYVANTNNLPDGTKHSLSGLKTVIVNNRSKRGYIYFRIKISGTYHVYYFVDNGNGWTS